MTKRWPDWAGRWYGILFRILVALTGGIFGLLMVGAGYYTAVDWKTGVSNWTTEAVLLILLGIFIVGYSLWGSFRPSKISLIPPSLLFLGVVIFGGLALLDDLLKGSAT